MQTTIHQNSYSPHSLPFRDESLSTMAADLDNQDTDPPELEGEEDEELPATA